MHFHAARHALTVAGSSRAGRCISLAALLLALGSESLQTAVADGDTRTISFHHIHTGENLTVTYKRNGRYDEDGLRKINHLMRDWRRNEEIRIDPKAIDIIWDVNREVGGTEAIRVICGYRAPATNAMLRRRSRGVAQFSQHTAGKAIDFYIPGVPLDEQRNAGLRLQRGGVGFYPGGGGQFVHMDTGSVRHWPRIPEAQYARILSTRPTLLAANSKPATDAPKRSLLASLFSGGKDREEDEVEITASTRSPTPRAKIAAAAPKAETAPVPMPQARPAAKIEAVAAKAEPAKPVKASAFALASFGGSKPVKLAPAKPAEPTPAEIIAARGYWQGPQSDPDAASAQPATKVAAAAAKPAPKPRAEPRPATAREMTAAATPWPLKSETDETDDRTNLALAFAALGDTPAAPRAAPMGSTVPRTASATTLESLGATTVARKSAAQAPAPAVAPAASDPLTAVTTARGDDPWLRAMLLAPDLQNYMTTSLLGETDPRQLKVLMTKPHSVVMMTFSDDPHLGMSAEKFAGTAVVFVSTVSFSQRTAMLQ